MQNDTPMMTKGSKSKPGAEIQYGGRLFPESGSTVVIFQPRIQIS